MGVSNIESTIKSHLGFAITETEHRCPLCFPTGISSSERIKKRTVSL